MAILFQRDESGSIRGVVQKLIKENQEFSPLKDLEFLYTYRKEEPQYIRGEMVEAVTKKLSTRERDLYHRDVEMAIFYDTWTQKTEPQKERLVYGQLCRIQVDINEHLEVALDEDERIKFRIIEPDVKVAIFSRELEKFGLPSEFQPALRVLMAKKMGRKGEDDE